MHLCSRKVGALERIDVITRDSEWLATWPWIGDIQYVFLSGNPVKTI